MMTLIANKQSVFYIVQQKSIEIKTKIAAHPPIRDGQRFLAKRRAGFEPRTFQCLCRTAAAKFADADDRNHELIYGVYLTSARKCPSIGRFITRSKKGFCKTQNQRKKKKLRYFEHLFKVLAILSRECN